MAICFFPWLNLLGFPGGSFLTGDRETLIRNWCPTTPSPLPAACQAFAATQGLRLLCLRCFMEQANLLWCGSQGRHGAVLPGTQALPGSCHGASVTASSVQRTPLCQG